MNKLLLFVLLSTACMLPSLNIANVDYATIELISSNGKVSTKYEKGEKVYFSELANSTVSITGGIIQGQIILTLGIINTSDIDYNVFLDSLNIIGKDLNNKLVPIKKYTKEEWYSDYLGLLATATVTTNPNSILEFTDEATDIGKIVNDSFFSIQTLSKNDYYSGTVMCHKIKNTKFNQLAISFNANGESHELKFTVENKVY